MSPFTWRYGNAQMQRLWGEIHKRRLWRRLWVALAEVQAEFHRVEGGQLEDLRTHMEDIDIARSLQIESEIHHDLMAELRVYAEQCPIGGRILHLGATSNDIKDNADVLRVRESLDFIIIGLTDLLDNLCTKIECWVNLPMIAFTHLQPAEPTTLGYRLAQYAQDLWGDWEIFRSVRGQLRGKGFSGAVGTNAAIAELIGLENVDRFNRRLSELLDLRFYHVTTQVYPRKQDYLVASALAGMGATLYKFAFDLRILQSPSIGEWAEPFTQKQVGSSAMPFKRNPVEAEKVDSLARALAQMPRLAWDNAAHSLLEVTLDDSANRRSMLPEMFLISDEILTSINHIVCELQINEKAIRRNLDTYGPFAATERILVTATKRGGNRQDLHERLRVHSLDAWQAVQAGQENQLEKFICGDPEILNFLSDTEIHTLMDVSSHIGDAAQRARELVASIRQAIKTTS